ncbi:hypothetical protein AAG570_009626 [Ranatra chinensis]|uniref:Uncharacterized protein n=1 Tax=Ranatra chinensis TaxID=642074 RepID=A0ABD0YQ76_9HEMI
MSSDNVDGSSYRNDTDDGEEKVSESSYFPSKGRGGGCSIEVEIVKRRVPSKKVNKSTWTTEEDSHPAVRSRKKWNIRPPLIGQVSATDSEDDTQKETQGGAYFGGMVERPSVSGDTLKDYKEGNSSGAHNMEDNYFGGTLSTEKGEAATSNRSPKETGFDADRPFANVASDNFTSSRESDIIGGHKGGDVYLGGIGSQRAEVFPVSSNSSDEDIGGPFMRRVTGADKIGTSRNEASDRKLGDGFGGIQQKPGDFLQERSLIAERTQDSQGGAGKFSVRNEMASLKGVDDEANDRKEGDGYFAGTQAVPGQVLAVRSNVGRSPLLSGTLSSNRGQGSSTYISVDQISKNKSAHSCQKSGEISTSLDGVLRPAAELSVSKSFMDSSVKECIRPGGSKSQRSTQMATDQEAISLPRINLNSDSNSYGRETFCEEKLNANRVSSEVEFLRQNNGHPVTTYTRKRELSEMDASNGKKNELKIHLEGKQGNSNISSLQKFSNTPLTQVGGSSNERVDISGAGAYSNVPGQTEENTVELGNSYFRQTYPVVDESNEGSDIFLNTVQKVVEGHSQSKILEREIEGNVMSSDRPLKFVNYINEVLINQPQSHRPERELTERRVDLLKSESSSSLDPQEGHYFSNYLPRNESKYTDCKRNGGPPSLGEGDFPFRKDCRSLEGDGDRPPSAASVNSTSRPLEWDSGADVGYSNYPANDNLSTLERLALARGSAGLFARSDPEGMTGNIKKSSNSTSSKKQLVPKAQSTPVSLSGTVKSCSSISPIFPNHTAPSGGGPWKQGDKSTPEEETGSTANRARLIGSTNLREDSKFSRSDHLKTEGSEVKETGNRPYIPLFPEVMKSKEGAEKSSGVRESVANHCHIFPEVVIREHNPDKKKLSSSLEDVKDLVEGECRASTFPRSQSQVDLRPTTTKQVVISNSSSSVATVVNNKPSRSIFKDGGNIFAGDSVKVSEFGTDTGSRGGGRTADSFEYLPGPEFLTTSQDTLTKDIRKAIDLLSDFVAQGKQDENAVIGKKRLVRDIVEKLINAEYLGDTTTGEEDVWSSGGRQPEGSSRDETSSISRSSSIQPQQMNTADKCIGTSYSTVGSRSASSGWCSSSEVSKRSGSSACGESRRVLRGSSSHPPITGESKKTSKKDIRMQKIEESSKDNAGQHIGGNSSSGGGGDWRLPMTASEKLLENRKLKEVKKWEEENLISYIESEKKNQLDWIKSEINHLSNLKLLLEKHQKLKSNVNTLKRTSHRVQTSGSKQGHISDSSAADARGHRRQKFPLGVKSALACGRNEVDSSGFKNSTRPATTPGRCHVGKNISRESGWSSHHYFDTDSEIDRVQSAPALSSRKVRSTVGEQIGGGHSKSVDVATGTVSEVAVQTGRLPKPLAYSIDFLQTSNHWCTLQANHRANISSICGKSLSGQY